MVGWHKALAQGNKAPFVYLLLVVIFVTMGCVFIDTFAAYYSKIDVQRQWLWWGVILAVPFLFCMFMGCMRVKILPKNSVKYLGKYHDQTFLASHGLMHVLLGVFAPALWPFSMAAGILWEFVECYSLDWEAVCDAIQCNGAKDVAVNTLGLGIGVSIATWHQQK